MDILLNLYIRMIYLIIIYNILINLFFLTSLPEYNQIKKIKIIDFGFAKFLFNENLLPTQQQQQ